VLACFDLGMSAPVKIRRLSDHEGRQLQQIVRRGGGRSEKSIVQWRRAMVVMASASGNTIPAIARLVATSEDRVREMLRRFNNKGMVSLDPQWAGGRPRQILDANHVTFQRTKTWKESNDPDRDAKLDHIEEVTNTWPDRCFAFDEFGPLTIRPFGGSC